MEQILVKLDIEGLPKAIDEIGQLEREMRILSEQKKKILKDTDNLSKASKQEAEAYAVLDERVKVLRKDKNNLSRDVGKLTQAQKANTKTIDGLTKRNAQLTAEMRKLDLTTKAGQARLKLLRAEFTQNDAKVRQFNASLGRHQANVGNYSSALTGVKQGLASMAAGITAAVMAFQRINQMMQESIELFKAQELAERQLEFAAGDASQALIEQAAALQKQTTFGDEATIQMQALLSSFGSTAEEVKALTPLIQDYAALSGQDLSQAATKVNNILNGTSTTLRGTQIRLSETASTTERYNAVLQEFSKFQGAAAALADTQAGKLDQLTNAYNDQREQLGAKLIPIQITFNKILMATIDVFTSIGQKLQPLGDAAAYVGDKISGLTDSVSENESVFSEIIEYSYKPFTWLFEVMSNIISVVTDTYNLFISSIERSIEPFNKAIDTLKDLAGQFNINLEFLNQFKISTKETSTGWDGLTDSINKNKQALIEQAQAEQDALLRKKEIEGQRQREQDKQAERDAEQRKRELQAIDESRNAQEKAGEKEREIIEALSADIIAYANNTEIAGDKVEAVFNRTLTEMEKRAMKAEDALGFLQMNLSQIQDYFIQIAQGEQPFDKMGVSIASASAALQLLNQGLATRFENEKARIEQTALAEKEAIEASTMSEEQKRIRIERAEQKKATAIEKIERKQAKQQKATAIIQSLVNTALGVTKAIATAPFPINLVMPAIIGGIGAVQTGIIAAQQFADGGQVADLGSGEGGAIPVAAQNIPALGNGDNVLATVKTGEVILNESQQARLKALTGSANVFRAIGVPGFADGGLVPSFSNTSRSTASRIEQSNAQAIGAMQSIKVVNVATETSGMATMVNNIETEATFG